MAAKQTSKAVLQQMVDALAQAGGNQVAAAAGLTLSRETFRCRLAEARRRGIKPSPGVEDLDNKDHLKHRLRRVEKELAEAQRDKLDEAAIKRRILQLQQNVAEYDPPSWMVNAGKQSGSPGVPTLFVSDLHWGERVFPSQINGVNRYDIATANKRLRRLAEGAVRLLKIISPKMDYPGIVVPLGGDMISGNIHDELTATNEFNSMESVLDVYGALTWLLTFMADTFGKVMVPCVTGNHGRDTTRIWNKDRHKTSFDWLLYCFLAKRFENDKRLTFHVPDGPDAYYKIFNHRYLLTHGDQFRGGDGMIGALGPIIRGDHKKRSRNAQIDMEYDTLLMGHWHQYIHLTRLIVNGSLKGYDEYAYNNNFGYEQPQQALWVTHPKYGITFRSPVFVDREQKAPKTAWVSIPA